MIQTSGGQTCSSIIGGRVALTIPHPKSLEGKGAGHCYTHWSCIQADVLLIAGRMALAFSAPYLKDERKISFLTSLPHHVCLQVDVLLTGGHRALAFRAPYLKERRKFTSLLHHVCLQADVLLIGGRMAFTFLAARGVSVGATQVEEAWLQVGGNQGSWWC